MTSSRSAVTASMAILGIAGLAVAGTANGQSTTYQNATGQCPSQQSVMSSTSTSATKGYLCANEYHKGDSSLKPFASQTFSQATNALYFPAYYCSAGSNKNVSITGPALMWGGGSYTATNWDPETSHEWSAGFVYTLEGGSVNFPDDSCDAKSSAAWNDPPVMFGMSTLSATGLPNNNQTAAGTTYSVTATAAPGGAAANQPAVLQDNGTTVAGGYMNSSGQVTFNWTPAQMGAHDIEILWPGTSTTLGAYTNTVTVNVSGGTALTVGAQDTVTWGTAQAPDPKQPNAKTVNTATIPVTVSTAPNPIPAGTRVFLVDATNSQPISAAPTAVLPTSTDSTTATVTVPFIYQPGRQYKMVAKIDGAPGQSYVSLIQAPGTPVPPTPPSRPTLPGHGAVPVPMAMERPSPTFHFGARSMEKATPPPGDQPAIDTATTTVQAGRRITARSRAINLRCPAGTFVLHSESWITGSDATPSARERSGRVTLTAPPESVGSILAGYALCKKSDVGGMSFLGQVNGTQYADKVTLAADKGLAFAGPGNDSVQLTGDRATGWGGPGNDVMSAKGRDSSVTGGPGSDRLTALGTRRVLLVGGPGRDVLISSRGPARINAADGTGGDRVVCRGTQTIALVDPGDIVEGTCQEVISR